MGNVEVRDKEIVMEEWKEFKGKVEVGIDEKGGKVEVEGWEED